MTDIDWQIYIAVWTRDALDLYPPQPDRWHDVEQAIRAFGNMRLALTEDGIAYHFNAQTGYTFEAYGRAT